MLPVIRKKGSSQTCCTSYCDLVNSVHCQYIQYQCCNSTPLLHLSCKKCFKNCIEKLPIQLIFHDREVPGFKTEHLSCGTCACSCLNNVLVATWNSLVLYWNVFHCNGWIRQNPSLHKYFNSRGLHGSKWICIYCIWRACSVLLAMFLKIQTSSVCAATLFFPSICFWTDIF